MSTIDWIIVALGVWVVSSYLCAGMIYNDEQGEWKEISPSIAEKWRRRDLGFSIYFGLMAGVFGPAGIFFVWLGTGFAEHGWRFTPKKDTQNAQKRPN